jgi:inner membrane protein
MDPITHTLVGASLARSGLGRQSPLATATLIIGANIPDLDVLAELWGGTTALWFRRGLTHGVLALAVWPLVLTLLVAAWDRWVRRRRGELEDRVRAGRILLLGALAVATHPLLDFLNTYGMRWLAPFSWTWYYGDTLFIFDPWVWGLLAVGLWLARRSAFWPRLALLGASLYALAMAVSGVLARQAVTRSLERNGERAERVMVAPVAITPFDRWVVAEVAGAYRVGMFHWLPRPRIELDDLPYELAPQGEVVRAARQERPAREFLSWARFPYFVVAEHADGAIVHIADARYTPDPEATWAAIRVPVPYHRR